MMKRLLGLLALVLALTIVSIDATASASRVAAGDVNGDGVDDLLIATQNFLVVAIAVGDGTFTTERQIALDPGTPIETTFVDLLGTSQLDSLVAYSDLGGVQIDRGNNQSSIRSYGLGAELSRTIRLPQSGASDWIFTSFAASEKGFLLKFNPTIQRFISAHSLTYSAPVRDVAFGTLTDSSRYTLAVLYSVHIELSDYDSSSGFAPPVAVLLPDSQVDQIETGSIRGNTLPDLLLWTHRSPAITTVSWTSSSIWETSSYTLGTAIAELTAGDVDGDGFADLPALNSARDEIVYFQNQSGTTFAASNLAMPFSVEIGDDVFIRCGNFASAQDGFVMVAPDAGDGPEIHFVPVESGTISRTISSTLSVPPEKPGNYANVVIRDTTNPELIFRSEHVQDWSTGAALVASNLVVQREIDTGSGLSPASDITINNVRNVVWSGAVETVPNQESADRSAFFLTPPLPVSLLKTLISPSGGTHGRTVVPVIETRDSATIFYRKNGGSWRLYNPERTQILFYRSGTLDAYATFGTFTGSMASASYTIDQPYDADTDYDGLPDFVEEKYGLDPLDGNTDSDDDGWRDLDELIRDTDPLDDAFYPSDLDTPQGDGWSDYDETLRQTDPTDPDSNPTVTGLEIPEAIIPVAVAESSLSNPTGVGGSALEAVLLTGHEIASATLTETPSLRMSVELPSISGYTDKNDAEIILLAYSPRKTYDPSIDGDESTTADEWLDAYEAEMQATLFEERTALTHDTESTAAVLALARLMERALALPAPNIIWHASGTASLGDIARLEQSIDLDEAAAYLEQHINETSLPGLVRTYIEWAQTNDVRGTIIERLAWALHGWTPEEGDAPESITAKQLPSNRSLQPEGIDFASIRSELNTLFLSIPTREIELEGTLTWDDRGFIALVQDGTTYGLDDGGMTLSAGMEVRVQGRAVIPSPYSDVVWVKLTALERLDNPTLAVNTLDTDNNGLADQWEAFYFPAGSLPTADPDGDGYSNQQEYEGCSDPTDPASLPTASGTRIRHWSLYETR